MFACQNENPPPTEVNITKTNETTTQVFDIYIIYTTKV